MLLHEPNTALMFSLLLNKFFFSFLHLTHAKLSLLSVFPIWSFLQKPKTNHGQASMTLSSTSLSLSLLNHQLSSLKITLFPLRSYWSKRSRASMVNFSQHHHKTPYPKPTHWKSLSSLSDSHSLKTPNPLFDLYPKPTHHHKNVFLGWNW